MKGNKMTIRSTFHILLLLFVLLTFSSHSVFGRGPGPTKREVEIKQRAVLLIGDHEGIDETDAQNAALLVTEELYKQGIAVIDPVHEVPAEATVYRVVLRRSDEKILFRLSEEDSVGTLLVQRELLLADIEEIASGASKLVSTLVHRKPISPDPVLLNAGPFIVIIPAKELASGLGVVGIGMSIDRSSYAVDIGFQTVSVETGSESDSDSYSRWSDLETESFNLLLGAIGGRYFFNKQNLSPYVGGGLAAMLYDKHPDEDLGMGPYAVLGIESRHYSRFCLKLELRIGRPSFILKLPSEDMTYITLGVAGGFRF
jgi:hypothetical protein